MKSDPGNLAESDDLALLYHLDLAMRMWRALTAPLDTMDRSSRDEVS